MALPYSVGHLPGTGFGYHGSQGHSTAVTTRSAESAARTASFWQLSEGVVPSHCLFKVQKAPGYAGNDTQYWSRRCSPKPGPASKLTPLQKLPSFGANVHSSTHRPCSSARASASTETSRAAAVQFTQKGFEEFLLSMQEQICEEAAKADGSGKTFLVDRWQRGEDPWAGYGITRVLEGGDLLEKAAANVSIIRGNLSPARAQAMSARGRGVEPGAPYFAAALSLVFHPRNPYVPTFRSDVRYFEVEGLPGWFGGGADLTPCYLLEEDAKQFHAYYKAICDKYSPSLYARCKALCDQYFYIPARKEHRGVGGLFFDDLVRVSEQNEGPHNAVHLDAPSTSSSRAMPSVASEPSPATSAVDVQREDDHMQASQSADETMPPVIQGRESEEIPTWGHQRASRESERDEVYSFVREVCEGFMPSYLPLAQKRWRMEYTDKERQWQLVRRGRYLEFNLLYDRGVKFGLDGGRVESIMVSAPPLIAWKYMVVPEAGSPEAALLEVLKQPREWV